MESRSDQNKFPQTIAFSSFSFEKKFNFYRKSFNKSLLLDYILSSQGYEEVRWSKQTHLFQQHLMNGFPFSEQLYTWNSVSRSTLLSNFVPFLLYNIHNFGSFIACDDYSQLIRRFEDISRIHFQIAIIIAWAIEIASLNQNIIWWTDFEFFLECVE